MQQRRPRSDILKLAMASLQQLLAQDYPGRERQWAEEVGAALQAIYGGLCEHAREAEAADGVFAEIDLTRQTLARRVGELQQQHAELASEARALAAELDRVAKVFQQDAPPDVSGLVGPRVPRPAPVPSLDALRQRTAALLSAVEQHEGDENKLVLESMNTDIGVGD